MLSSFSTRRLVITAMCVALALALSLIELFTMPMGGSVTPFSMFFIVLAAYWFGVPYGAAAGLALGLLKLLLGAYIVHPAQLMLDYPLAFAMLGAAGFFNKQRFGLQIGYTVGVLGRFVMHFISGLIFFAEYTPEDWSPVIYSLWYNISYILPEALVTLIIVSAPVVKNTLDRIAEQQNE